MILNTYILITLLIDKRSVLLHAVHPNYFSGKIENRSDPKSETALFLLLLVLQPLVSR